jgi:hypothetical protein
MIVRVNRALATAIAAVALLAGLTACSNSKTLSSSGYTGQPTKPASRQPLTASTAFTLLSSKVATVKLSGTVTAANDPNHLLGRPGQYTSKVTFTDSRIKASDVIDSSKGSVDLGGSIEVFADPTDAAARANYLEAVTRLMSALTENDYLHGTVLLRVSHYLPPAQGTAYKSAAASLG